MTKCWSNYPVPRTQRTAKSGPTGKVPPPKLGTCTVCGQPCFRLATLHKECYGLHAYRHQTVGHAQDIFAQQEEEA